VGEHILLGGDNIDLALARFIEQQLAVKGVKLDTLQLHALWQNCRVGKEKLLEEGSDLQDVPVTILGKGTGLVGGTIKAKLRRADIERILLEGFFPTVSSQDMPQRARRAGLQELGCPTRPMPPSRATWPASCGNMPRRRRARRCGGGRAAWRARLTCCSTAECCGPA